MAGFSGNQYPSSMRRLFVRLGVVVAAAAAVCEEPSLVAPARAAEAKGAPALGQVYFAGLDRITATAKDTYARSILQLPETKALTQDISKKLARSLAANLQAKRGNQTPDAAALLEPLIRDLIHSETRLEIWGAEAKAPSWSLAVKLSPEREAAWKSTLEKLAQGWERKDKSPHWALAAANSWAFITPGKSGGANPLRDRLAAGAAGGTNLLQLDINFPKLASGTTNALFRALPETSLRIHPRNDSLRVEGAMKLAQPAAPGAEPWQIPTAQVRDPLISFTAVRGLSRWLGQQPFIKALDLPAAPNQLFLWDNSGSAMLQLKAAAPVPKAGAAADKFASRLLPNINTNLAKMALGQLTRNSTNATFYWKNLPFLFPYFRPVSDATGDYVLGGIFPITPDPATNPPPAALFAQITSRTNLLYYDWEITEARIAQFSPLFQFLPLFTSIPAMSPESAVYKWLEASSRLMGETITEVAAVSDRELALVRKAPLGLNSTELFFLASWLESTNFPALPPLKFQSVPASRPPLLVPKP